ncbi:disease resistance protein RPV1-like isoform X2 [Lotus japonicus]|uniref:disease resistance protein RPV1-like isoform X2 n=1 Tax=Lotus japonicus TaxID=34305 RepID=UPI00258BA84D|nr:disease resistance protein RPV1-like isoform X2 [Lotus japonicus]
MVAHTIHIPHLSFQAFFLMALLPSSSSSFSSFTYAFTYDVFLSFRGSDTRFGFTGNLHKTLSDKGIHTFIDDKDLKRGDEITPALIKAIQESRIAIPIFSVNYASSSFCLDELVTIMECVKAKGRLVLPVFYDVDPSHVRHQSGTYAEAMDKHEKRFKDSKEKLKDNMERLQKWKMALNQAANLSGSHYKPSDGSYEHDFIGKIVKEVLRKINRVALHIADYPVGLESQVEEVLFLMDVGSDDKVHMVGIHGIGGIGKTTLALAVYNSIADHFEGLCFLENVRENSNKHGLPHLQKIFLVDVLEEKEIEITSVGKGISMIQRRLQQKRVLLILDDVNKMEQLQGIIGRSDWFGRGSRVIITTRDKHLLALHGVESTYEVETLNENDAVKLLRWKAFKEDKVRPNYEGMLSRALAYASGLPLALEVIGSNLYGKSIQEWESALEQYEKIPTKKIQQVLEVSFAALEKQEQSVFLDVACCFKGYHLEEVENILNAHHNHCIKYQIVVLVDKSLIKITHSGYVTLHDLIEDMGKEIVRQESPQEPGNRSRLWFHEDIFEVLEQNTGTSKIEMMHLDYPSFEEVNWDGEAFKEMKKLKTLVIRKTHFSKGPEHLPNSLRVLEWWKYPSQHLPSDFHPKKLSICILPYSSMVSLELGRSSKKFETMKVLNLDFCESLTEIPNLTGLPNLEELSFEFCSKLITIDCSVGLLAKLKSLNAGYCSQLRSFPSLKLPSLEKLYLHGCLSLESFPEILEKMENIRKLDLRCTNISKFPHSFGNLTRLLFMWVSHLLPLRSLDTMPELLWLEISQRRIYYEDSESESEEEVMDGGAVELVPTFLNEKESSMLLPSKLECLTLEQSHLSDEYLVLVPSLFPNLQELELMDCPSITVVPECIKECRFLRRLFLNRCEQLREICEGILPRLNKLVVCGCPSLSSSCRSMLVRQELGADVDIHLQLRNLEGETIPERFEHQNRGPSPSLSFWFRNDFPLILLCQLFRVNWGCTLLQRLSKDYFDTHMSEICRISKNKWNYVEFRIERVFDFGIGIHVLKEQNMQDIRFMNPDKRRKIDLNLAPLEEDDLNVIDFIINMLH